jgi:hypothetical protein
MRIVARAPPFDVSKHNALISDGWVPLKEPGNIVIALLASVPLMIVNVMVSGIIILLFTPAPFTGLVPTTSISTISISIGIFPILGLLMLMVAHEFVHLAFIPNFLRSDKTYAGITYVGAFAVTEEVLTKRRHMLISIMPFVVISLLMPMMLGVIGILGPLVICLILLNSLASSVDILIILLVAFQVPADSRLISNGMKTYWKPSV